MAILDRPMFRRPLTKDQLRGYGIPAFANGGVVQKFQTGGKVDLGYTESGAISDKPIFNPFKGLSKEDYNRMSSQEVLNFYQEVDQTRIPGKIRGAESVDRLYNILRGEGPDLPGFMEQQKRPQMTEPYAESFKFTDSPALAQSDEELMKQKEEYQVSKAQGAVDDIQDDIEYQQKIIEQKKKQGFDTKEEEDKIAELQKKKEEEQAKVDAIKTDKTTEQGEAIGEAAEAMADSEKALSPDGQEENLEDTKEPTPTGGDPDATKERSDLERLRELAKERSALYKELIGDPEKMRRQQGFMQLAQFGLNLASARGGNLAEKIAKSAKDPLQTFAALAREAAQDERAIEVAAIEGAEKQLALEKELEKKQDKEFAFENTVELIAKYKTDGDRSQAIDLALQVDDPDKEKLSTFETYLEQRPSDILGAAKNSGIIILGATEDAANYVRDGELLVEDFVDLGNKVFVDIVDGEYVAKSIRPGALDDKKKKTLTQDDFITIPGVKVIP